MTSSRASTPRSSWSTAVAFAGALAALSLAAGPAAAEGYGAAPPSGARASKDRVDDPKARAGAPAPTDRVRGAAAPGAKERSDGPKDRGAAAATGERGEAGAAPNANGRDAAPRAGAAPKSRRGKTARRERAGERAGEAPCVRDRVELGRATGEVDNFSLLRCDGKPAEGAIERLSILLRPYSAPKPTLPITSLSPEGRGREWAPGVRSADAGLLARLQAVAERYRGKRLVVVSGYRPASVGSYHKDARAVDLRVEGVRNEDLVAFCRGLRDTGCGYYPNSSFVHFDVRPGGTGHVYWIDASGPGEAPRYVGAWPPPRDEPLLERLPKPEEAAPRDEHTHPDVAGKRPGRGLGASDRSEETPPKAPPPAASPERDTEI